MKSKNQHIYSADPFKVPDGYFESFQQTLLANLPNKEPMVIPKISLWGKMKPWVYMAALFAGAALMVHIFNSRNEPGLLSAKGLDIAPDDIDEFYAYYEDQYASANYRQTFLLDEVYEN